MVRKGRAPSCQSAGWFASNSQSNSHSRSVLSVLPERAKRPLGLNDTEFSLCVCPSKVRRHLLLETSHSRSVLSWLPERTKRPSGLNDTEFTQPACPVKVRRHLPLETSHSRSVSS